MASSEKGAETRYRNAEHFSIDQLAEDRPKILVVDDRPENLVATRKTLRTIDADIIEAATGNEALSSMLRHQFAVVLLDVQMPEMDGFETATLMQEDAQMRQTPVIFVTAISKEEQYANRAADIGAVDYIFKPINPRILISKVQVYVDLFRDRQRISQMNDILLQNNVELERFAYICSHDLKEPARNIASFVELYASMDREQKEEEGTFCIERISKNADRMLEMIEGILEYSRVESRLDSLAPVDCGELLTLAQDNLQHVLEENNVQLTHDDMPVIRGNRIQILQVFQNLIANAVKFNDADQVRINISHRAKGDMVEFIVSDNGIGIESEHREKIFVVFERLNRREDYPGSGVGLALCQKIVRNHDGEIWYEPAETRGSQFHFTLPKQD